MLEPKVYSVAQINRYIKKLLENDFILNSFWVKGEISNFKANSSGHLYFTLKDANSAIQCVMFKGSAILLPFLLEDGMAVLICGYVSLYEKTGQYQLYAELIEPVGTGALSIAFEQKKAMLAKEGLFDLEYKREITPFPKRIILITSPTGAAVRDMIQIIRRRNKTVAITVIPTVVQGEKAAFSIVSALKLANKWGKADTIIVGRGGGSMEDLWCFNEEIVARAIFASRIPVISAIGHETDFTIADFVADLRAPTPSAAAELAICNQDEAEKRLNTLFYHLNQAAEKRIEKSNNKFLALSERPVLKRPMETIQNHEIYLENLRKKLHREWIYRMEKLHIQLENKISRLESLSPLSALKKGYSIIYKNDNKVLNTTKQLNIGDTIKVILYDGSFMADIKEVLSENGEEKTKF